MFVSGGGTAPQRESRHGASSSAWVSAPCPELLPRRPCSLQSISVEIPDRTFSTVIDATAAGASFNPQLTDGYLVHTTNNMVLLFVHVLLPVTTPMPQ